MSGYCAYCGVTGGCDCYPINPPQPGPDDGLVERKLAVFQENYVNDPEDEGAFGRMMLDIRRAWESDKAALSERIAELERMVGVARSWARSSVFEDCEECARYCAEMLPGTRLSPNDTRIADHLDDVRMLRAALKDINHGK